MGAIARIAPVVLAISVFGATGCNLFRNTSPEASPGVLQEQSGDNPITIGVQGVERSDTDPLELFQNPQIRKEINLTDEQATKIKGISDQFRQRVRALVSGLKLGQMEPEEREKKLDQIKGELEKEVGVARNEVGKVLTPEQLKRFKEITLQIYGFGILSYEHFIQELKLTPEQQAKLKKLRDDTWAKMRINLKVPQKGSDNRQVIAANRKRMDQILQESNAKALAILTPEQQKILEMLKGKKFEFVPPRPS